MRSRPLLIGLLLAFSACPNGPSPEDDDGGIPPLPDGGEAPLLQLGTGTESFVPVEDGDELQVIAGPQGGHHIWVSLRTRPPVNPKGVLINVTGRYEGGELLPSELKLNLVKNGPWLEWYALVAMVPDPDAVAGKEVELSLQITDSANVTATDSRRVIAKWP